MGETRTVTEGDVKAPWVFQRKLLGRIIGPVKEGDDWRIQRKKKLDVIIRGRYCKVH